MSYYLYILQSSVTMKYCWQLFGKRGSKIAAAGSANGLGSWYEFICMDFCTQFCGAIAEPLVV